MAFTSIPNEAIDKITELSAGAWKLYCVLAKHRNRKTGKCCPSAQTLARALNMERRHIFRLKNELAEAKWARFDGGDVLELFGFTGDKNVTTPDDNNATVENVTSDKKVTKGCQKSHLVVTKKSLAYKEEPEERTIVIEPKGKARPSAVPPAVAYIRHLTQRFPDKTLWPRIVSTLGDDFDGERLTNCYENWVSHGWNKMNLVWLFEWYTKGIPERENQNGRHQKPGKETPNQRNARELDELIYQSLAPSGGFEPADKPDPGDEGLAVAFRRL